MPSQFTLPDVGEGLTEAEITVWHVGVGDTVELNQTLLEVETAKAVVELPSPFAGTVLELACEVGDVVPVGAPLISIGTSGEELADSVVSVSTPADTVELLADPATGPADAPAAGPSGDGRGSEAAAEPVLVGYGVRVAKVARRPRKVLTVAPAPNGAAVVGPLVRRLARKLSVDLNAIAATGPHGRITRDDVVSASLRGAAPVAGALADLRTPIRGTRKRIAEAMVRSAFTAPHVTEWVSVDITRTLKLMGELRAAPATKSLRLTPLSLVARATLLTLAQYPEINSSWDETSNEILQHRDVNLGIAVASPRGLIVPNIRAAQDLDFPALCTELSQLVANARANKTTVQAMQHGTFTITNIGVFGVDGATPILNPGESAILALGRTNEMPWNHKGRVRLRSVTMLSLSFDHRLVDGELGSRVLAGIAEMLERPARALGR